MMMLPLGFSPNTNKIDTVFCDLFFFLLHTTRFLEYERVVVKEEILKLGWLGPLRNDAGDCDATGGGWGLKGKKATLA